MKKLVLPIILFISLFFCSQFFGQLNINTFAGPLGGRGHVDGVGTDANFFYPDAICTDLVGNIYVADDGRSTVRKITPTGVVTTVAGTPGVHSFANGTGASALFNYPKGICFAPSGNIYVADTYNHRIREVTPAGVVTTFAGSGVIGSLNGTGPAATFNYPMGMCADPSGNLYVIEPTSTRIRKITPAGVVTTFAIYSNFTNARSICSDAAGNIYVADLNNNKILKHTPAGLQSVFAGSGTAAFANGTGIAASFYAPYGVCSDAANNIYVTDRGNYRVRKITPTAVVTTIAGSGSHGVALGVGTIASFNPLAGICVDGSGNVFVSSAASIRKINSSNIVSILAGGGGDGAQNFIGTDASFTSPRGLCSDASGNIYVADYSNNRIRKITPASAVSTIAGNGSSGSTDGLSSIAEFNGPSGVCMDAAGNIYVADSYNNKIRKITPAGVVSTYAGTGLQGSIDGLAASSSFYNPYAICIDTSGNIYVADRFNNKIRKITSTGIVSTLAGSGAAGAANGTGTLSTFSYPSGICLDALGNIYVADASNHLIRKITATGIVSTLAGSGVAGLTDGVGIGSSFNEPTDICISASGNLYVADTYSQRIRKIATGGIVSTIAGTSYGSLDGSNVVAQFAYPYGICIDPSGNIYVTENNTSRVRKIAVACITPTITASVTNSVICMGNSITFNGSGANIYAWTGGVNDNVAFTPTVSGTQTYTVTGSQTGSCTLSNTATIIITVNSNPTLTVNNGAICSGNSFTIAPSGANTYTYSSGVNIVNPITNTSYSVIGSSAQGCTNSAISSVTVNANPTITVNSGSICSGNSFTISPSGANTYSYSAGSNVVSPLSNQTYTVVGTSANSCTNATVSNVIVNALPSINITSNNTLICVGQLANLTAAGAITYTWNTTATSSVITISPTSTTVYTVTGTAANSCFNSATITQSVSTCTEVEALEGKSNLSVIAYPNPGNGLINLELNQAAEITIVSLMGEKIYSAKHEYGKQMIDLRSFSNGIYIITLNNGFKSQAVKIVKN